MTEDNRVRIIMSLIWGVVILVVVAIPFTVSAYEWHDFVIHNYHEKAP